MSAAARRLSQTLEDLHHSGAPPPRIQLVAAALSFKRSWIDLAQLLVQVREEGNYRGWGYDDFMTYCQQELSLSAATVDKLTVSFGTLRRHAPQTLQPDPEGDAPAIPSYHSLDYFSRALSEPRWDGSEPRNAPQAPIDPGVMQRLHSAVFEQGASVHRLRNEFDPILRPKAPEAQREEALRRIGNASRKLLEQLDQLEQLDDLSLPSRDAAQRSVQALLQEMDALLSPSDASADAGQKVA